MYCRGNRAAAGMTLMCAAILTVEQIGVDRDSSVTDIHKKQFIGQREKFLLVFLKPVFCMGTFSVRILISVLLTFKNT